MRVSDLVAKFIYESGIETVFMVPGGGSICLTDGLVCNKSNMMFAKTAPFFSIRYSHMIILRRLRLKYMSKGWKRLKNGDIGDV